MTLAFLNTRGRMRHRDYDFLCGAPPVPWWRGYADHTTFERPTILVESGAGLRRVYLSGIPSDRRDAVGSTIRYTVVLEDGPAGGAPPGRVPPDALVALVAGWLADQDPAAGTRTVSAALDAAFPEADVERWLAAPDPGGRAEVRRRLLDVVGSLPRPAPDRVPPPVPRDWLGGLGWPPARAAFVERVRELAADRPGRALVLNLVDAPADLAGLLDDGRPLAVLAPEPAVPTTITALAGERVDPGKKAPPPPRTARRAPERPGVLSSSPPIPPPPRRSAPRLPDRIRLLSGQVLILLGLLVTVVTALLWAR